MRATLALYTHFFLSDFRYCLNLLRLIDLFLYWRFFADGELPYEKD